MLDRFPVTAVLPAHDLGRARRFYTEVLGLQATADPEDELQSFRAGDGTLVALAEAPADRVPVAYPVASFAVRGIDELVAGLKERGAGFVPLSSGGAYAGGDEGRDPDVANFGPVKAAFLRDSEGNVLALNQVSRAKVS
ncbi:VOC family protein [Patulibacter minatonensis]|uniref:VOC family protein n=1 Tax=Patulibacter minatonensis TaxID=298163 RepID=UPI0004B1F17A|nr:VOC family protein [Patulibacter minatonensis]